MTKRDQTIEYPQRQPKYVPITRQEAVEQITTVIRHGLASQRDASSTGRVCQAIDESIDSTWTDAVANWVDALDAMDLVLCRKFD